MVLAISVVANSGQLSRWC